MPKKPGVVDRPRALEHQRRVHAVDLGMLRDGNPADLGAKLLQRGHGRHDTGSHVRLDGLGETFLEDADPQPPYAAIQVGQRVDAIGDAAALARVVVVVSGHRLQCGRDVRHCARHRPDVVHAGLGGEADREVRHQPERRLQPDHAAIGRGQPDGAALVAAERDIHLARGQRRAGARRGPAGDARRIVRVQRLAIVAHEPVHHVLAGDFSASRQHPRHDGRVDVGDEALQDLRGEDLRDAGHADMVLEAHRLAGQQSAVLAADGALPEPGLVAVLGQRRAMARAALGKQPRRGGLVGARLHEGVQFAHGIADERQIELRITAAQMEVERGGEFDQLDCIGHCEHGVPLGADCGVGRKGQALTSTSAWRSTTSY